MSDSDDWEKEVDQKIEPAKPTPKAAASDDEDWEAEVDNAVKKPEEKPKAFDDEKDVFDEEPKKKEEKKEPTPASQKKKTEKKDYDKMFEERNAKYKKATTVAAVDAKMSAGMKQEAQSRKAEEDIAEQLFAAEITTDASSLATEKDYTKFAKQVSDVLYEGRTPYNIPAFFTELVKGLGRGDLMKTEDVKKIVDAVTVVYNGKVADDKKKDPSKAKKAKANAKP